MSTETIIHWECTRCLRFGVVRVPRDANRLERRAALLGSHEKASPKCNGYQPNWRSSLRVRYEDDEQEPERWDGMS